MKLFSKKLNFVLECTEYHKYVKFLIFVHVYFKFKLTTDACTKTLHA